MLAIVLVLVSGASIVLAAREALILGRTMEQMATFIRETETIVKL